MGIAVHGGARPGVVLILTCGEEPAAAPSNDLAGQSVLFPCDGVRESSLAPDEVSPLGFAPDDVLSFVVARTPLEMTLGEVRIVSE